MSESAERKMTALDDFVMAFVRIGRDMSVPIPVRNFATNCRDRLQEYILASSERREPPADSYPKPCGICAGIIQSSSDLDWHGYGNCRDIPDIVMADLNIAQLLRDLQGHIAGELGERLDKAVASLAEAASVSGPAAGEEPLIPTAPVHKYAGWPGKAVCGAIGEITSIRAEDVTCVKCEAGWPDPCEEDICDATTLPVPKATESGTSGQSEKSSPTSNFGARSADSGRSGSEKSLCQICGQPMPAGEEMFNYHGYSGPCPEPAKEKA